MASQFFYDGQIRRFLIQFIRIMSNFSVEFGKDRNGISALQQVPVFYGDSSRQVAQILRGNSENATPTVPAMACYISGFQYDRTRVQEPYHVSKVNIRERSYNSTTDQWGQDQGDAFTVERLMPVPYLLTLKVDIWTSNTEQKLQLIEQMVPLFNPALEIQSTDNYVDWTSLSAIFLKDTSWTSRTVPMMGDDSIDVATLTFDLPIWLSLPAKVKRLGVIEKMFASIYDANGQLIDDILDLPTNTILGRIVVSPMDYGVIFFNNTLQLFTPNNIVSENSDSISITPGTAHSWNTLIDVLGGELKNGITQMRLDQPSGTPVVGTVSYHPTDTSLLLISPFADTTPANTLLPFDAIIDPYTVNVDDVCVNPMIGARYLILNDIGSADNIEAAQAWRGTDNVDLIAKANDIIEYDGAHWHVTFNSESHSNVKYCTNLKTGIQFKWLPEHKTWVKSIEGQYNPGDWTLVL